MEEEFLSGAGGARIDDHVGEDGSAAAGVPMRATNFLLRGLDRTNEGGVVESEAAAFSESSEQGGDKGVAGQMGFGPSAKRTFDGAAGKDGLAVVSREHGGIVPLRGHLWTAG
jgi:hypothetical protein